MPVPPRPAARVPVQLGAKVWVLAPEVIVRTILSSVEVANTWVAPVWAVEYWPPKAVMPLPDPPESVPQVKAPFDQTNLPVDGSHV